MQRPFSHRFYNVTIALIVLNLFVFLLNYLVRSSYNYLALHPRAVIELGYYWQVVTYMFVHGGFSHILFNMLGLFIFGIQLERHMGSTEFLVLYLFTGIGTGLFSLLVGTAVVGASGAIYGLLLAFATYFPHAKIYIMGILPVRAPIAVLVFVGLSIFFQFSGLIGGVAHLAHLAGVVLAFLYFVARLGINPIRVFMGRR